MFLIAANALADDAPPSVGARSDAVLRLLDAGDVAAIEAAFAEAPHDRPFETVRRSRILDLAPTPESEARYLEMLPRTEAELFDLRDLLTGEPLRDEPRAFGIVDALFERGAKLVPRHPEFHRAFLEACEHADGDAALAELACSTLDQLLGADTPATAAALRETPLEFRLRLCGGEDPVQLSDAEVVAACSSGL